MAIKSKLSFHVPASLQHEVRIHVIKDGYGLRGKSKWISEAIQNLLSLNNFPDLVSYSDGMRNLNVLETITIDGKLMLEMNKALLEIRKKYPILEGIKSRIIRTAIMQRIIRS